MRSIRAGFSAVAAAIVVTLTPGVFPIPSWQLQAATTAVSFTDRGGTPLGTILSNDARSAIAVPLKRISPFFLQAVVAAEDRRFYAHGAVDWLALARATLQSARCLCNAGGASTITMQLARERYNLPGGIRGKLLQIWDAARIASGSSKSKILESYANEVAMGGNTYGVEAAARSYFGVPAADLDLAQAALLAGIPNDPVDLNPRGHLRNALLRQHAVLRRMTETGFITTHQAALAAHEVLYLRPPTPELAFAQHLLFRLAGAVREMPVRTTIDLALQRFVQAQARDVVSALAGRNVTQAAALVVDNRTGDVLAYLGSTNYFDDAYLGRNDGVQTLRQPGSTLKPFLYEYALERRVITPNEILPDVPTSYAIPNGELYSPEDYTAHFSGPVTVRLALANSLNVPAVRVLSNVGVPAFLERLHEIGFSQLRRAPDYYGLGLTLGAGEVTLWELAHAYVTLARSGSAIPLRTVLANAPPNAVQLGDPADWQLVAAILSDRYARAKSFGVGSVIDMPFPALVKTGTSSDYRDTWTVGGTPEYTVAVWVGNFSGAPMRKIAGIAGAGPLWNRIMLHLYERRDPPRFRAPYNLPVASAAALAKYATNSQTYDEWRDRQDSTVGGLRILFPQDGNIFEDKLNAQDSRRALQQIEFRVSRPKNARVSWLLNGKLLATGTADAYFWEVHTGNYTLTARAAKRSQTVHFRVIRQLPRASRGFALVRS